MWKGRCGVTSPYLLSESCTDTSTGTELIAPVEPRMESDATPSDGKTGSASLAHGTSWWNSRTGLGASSFAER
jgi:hypothetical protein